MPKVWNRHHKDVPAGAVYIGRGTPWGNPFVIGKHGDRDAVCNAFERHLEARPHLRERVKKELVGKDLVCSCYPARCHGDLLLKIANEE